MTPTLSVVVAVLSVPFAVAVVVVGEGCPLATAIKSVVTQMMPRNNFIESLDDATGRMVSEFFPWQTPQLLFLAVVLFEFLAEESRGFHDRAVGESNFVGLMACRGFGG